MKIVKTISIILLSIIINTCGSDGGGDSAINMNLIYGSWTRDCNDSRFDYRGQEVQFNEDGTGKIREYILNSPDCTNGEDEIVTDITFDILDNILTYGYADFGESSPLTSITILSVSKEKFTHETKSEDGNVTYFRKGDIL